MTITLLSRLVALLSLIGHSVVQGFDAGYNYELTLNALQALDYSENGMQVAASQTLQANVFGSLPHWNRG